MGVYHNICVNAQPFCKYYGFSKIFVLAKFIKIPKILYDSHSLILKNLIDLMPFNYIRGDFLFEHLIKLSSDKSLVVGHHN